MKKMYYLSSLIIIALIFTWPSTAAESLNEAMQECAEIKRDLLRLACFDKLSGNVTDYAKQAIVTQSQAKSDNKPTRTAQAQAEPPMTAEDEFGLEKKSEAENMSEISSTIPGEFIGLSKDDEFTLANGQTWIVTDSSSLYHRATNPSVVISRGLFGSYRIKVAHLNKTLKVKRIN